MKTVQGAWLVLAAFAVLVFPQVRSSPSGMDIGPQPVPPNLVRSIGPQPVPPQVWPLSSGR